MYLSITILVLIFLYFSTFNYKSKNLLKGIDKKEHPLKFLYPGIWVLFDVKSSKFHTNKKETKKLEKIYPGEDRTQITRLYQCKKGSYIILSITIMLALSIIVSVRSQGEGGIINGKYINRPAVDSLPLDIILTAKIGSGENLITHDISLSVNPRRITDNELNEKLKSMENYIDQAILGSNKSLDYVTKKVNLIQHIPNIPVKIEWDLGNQSTIETDGNINSKNIVGQDQIVCIKALLTYNKWSAEYPIWIHLYKPVKSDEKQWKEVLMEAVLKAEEENPESDRIELPDTIDDKKITYKERPSKDIFIIFVMGILLIVAICCMFDRNLDKMIHKRSLEMMMDYPEIINKFILLIEAGLTIPQIFNRVTYDYIDKRDKNLIKKRYSYEEMIYTWHEMQNGISEYHAIENFGKRIGLIAYVKFCSLLNRNIRKGAHDITHLLEIEMINSFESRRETAKILGEEAGTKLLIPMSIMLIVVILLIMIPAFMNLSF